MSKVLTMGPGGEPVEGATKIEEQQAKLHPLICSCGWALEKLAEKRWGVLHFGRADAFHASGLEKHVLCLGPDVMRRFQKCLCRSCR